MIRFNKAGHLVEKWLPRVGRELPRGGTSHSPWPRVRLHVPRARQHKVYQEAATMGLRIG